MWFANEYTSSCVCMRSACLLKRQNGVVCKTHSVLLCFVLHFNCIVSITCAYLSIFLFLRSNHKQNYIVDSLSVAFFVLSFSHHVFFSLQLYNNEKCTEYCQVHDSARKLFSKYKGKKRLRWRSCLRVLNAVFSAFHWAHWALNDIRDWFWYACDMCACALCSKPSWLNQQTFQMNMTKRNLQMRSMNSNIFYGWCRKQNNLMNSKFVFASDLFGLCFL